MRGQPHWGSRGLQTQRPTTGVRDGFQFAGGRVEANNRTTRDIADHRPIQAGHHVFGGSRAQGVEFHVPRKLGWTQIAVGWPNLPPGGGESRFSLHHDPQCRPSRLFQAASDPSHKVVPHADSLGR